MSFCPPCQSTHLFCAALSTLLLTSSVAIEPYFSPTGEGGGSGGHYFRPGVGAAICAGVTAFAVGVGIGVGIGAIVFDREYYYRRGGGFYGPRGAVVFGKKKRRRRRRGATMSEEEEEEEEAKVKKNIYEAVEKFEN